MRPKPLIAKLAIRKSLKVEELNRYAKTFNSNSEPS